MKLNSNYSKLDDTYLFSQIEKKVQGYGVTHSLNEIIRLGIGDATRPLAMNVVEAMKYAAVEMGNIETFRGYGEAQGYSFLREAICSYYKGKKVSLSSDEIFVNDGAKSDLGNILDIFSQDNTVLIQNPVYPVYVETNIMYGTHIKYMAGSTNNDFLPLPDEQENVDFIYLCSPNNPTGGVYNRSQLEAWVNYALKHDAVIFFDSAYEAFVQEDNHPTSIYQIEGAKKCAIEFGSFSKTAGFTGTRCGYTIIPRELIRQGKSLNELWLRRQGARFNGVSYIVQRGAEAAFSDMGLKHNRENIKYYLKNAEIIASTLTDCGIWFTGGRNSPYIWLECPFGMTSWTFFDFLLEKTGIVGVPGEGFGSGGEKFFRLSAFGTQTNIIVAMQKFSKFINDGKQ